MNLGIITDSIGKQSTGIGNYAKNIIDVLMQETPKSDFFFIDYKSDNFYQGNNITIENNFPIFKTYLWHNIVSQKIRDYDFDYVFNLSGCPHWYPYNQKEIFFVYDISWLLLPQYHPFGRVLILKTLFKKSLENANKIVVDSSHAKEELITAYKVPKDKIYVVYPFLPKKISQYRKPSMIDDNPYILFLGTLEPRKNIPTLLMAFKQLKTKNKIAHKLVISGKNGWKYRSIYSLVKSLDIEKEVIFTGYISNEEKAYLYKNAAVFVYPSFYEGFGIPVIEALSYNCPVITSNTSSLPEVIGNAGIKINPQSIEELNISILKVIKNRRFRLELIRKGRSQVKKFANREQIKAFLHELKNE